MKQHSFLIDQRQVKELFYPIRNKKELISLLMKTVKLMLINQVPHETAGEVRLVVSKMSRLFYFSDEKYFSICFPFTVIEDEDNLVFNFESLIDIDSKTSSDIISLIGDLDDMSLSCGYTFAEPIVDLSNSEPNIWPLLLSLLTMDDGYLRYDYDEKNENGLIHPLNHYDIFYSSKSTFKVGLRDKLTKGQMLDLVKIETNCHFLDT